jgi:hypothetical protein
MARSAAIILVGLGIVAAAASTARAQTAAGRLSIFGVAGAGTFGDDEGNLGGGFVGGGGVGIELSRGVRVEMAVATTHHEQIASITWEGRPIVATGRVVRAFGDPASRVRAFAGAGLGFGRYSGTRTDTVRDGPLQPPRLETVAFTVNGLAAEGGGGVEIRLGARVFIRPEAWLAIMGGDRTQGLEPTFTMPRADVSVGVRF